MSLELSLWLEQIAIWRLQRKEKDMSLFGSRPKDERPAEEDYALNGLNELHSRAVDFVNAQDYVGSDIIVQERVKYEKEHGMEQGKNIKFDYDFNCFKRR